MVTNLKEGSRAKCEQYWPELGTKEYGPFKVTLTDQQVFADYTIRQLFVSVSSVVVSCLEMSSVELPALLLVFVHMWGEPQKRVH